MRTRVSPVQFWTLKAEGAGAAAAVRIRAWPLDVVLVLLLAVVGAGAVLLELPPAIRIGLGLPLVLFFPGYALASAFFPRHDGPDGVERVALALGLSLANIPFVALALSYSRWSISTTPLVVSLTAVTVIAGAVAVERRRRLPANERYRVHAALPPLSNPRTWDRPTRMTVGLAVLALLLLGAGGLPVVVNRIAGDAMTEFAIYNQAGEPQFYPRQVNVGEPAVVDLSVANREGQTITYTLAITGAGSSVDPLPRITLADGETWNGAVRFTVDETGDGLPVRFELWRTDHTNAREPYRVLQLIMDGRVRARTDVG